MAGINSRFGIRAKQVVPKRKVQQVNSYYCSKRRFSTTFTFLNSFLGASHNEQT